MDLVNTPMPLDNRIRQPIRGVEQLRGFLKALPEEVRTSVLGDMCDAGADPMVAAAKTFAPRRTGALKKSIGKVVRKYPQNHRALAVVGPTRGKYAKGRKIKQGGDFSGADEPSKYAHLVEFGFTRADGSRQPAQPFMRLAAIGAETAVAEAMAKGAEKGIEKARRKLVKS